MHIRNLDPNKIKINENSYKNILIYHIVYVPIKNLSYTTINSVNPLYLIINKINGYIEESTRKNYLTLVSTDEHKDALKIYEELWNKIRGIIRLVTNISSDYDVKYMKIKFNSDDDLPLKRWKFITW